MFLFRSAFWLIAAFMVIHPGVDINAAASRLSAQAVAKGQDLIVEQIMATDCTTIQCVGGKAVLAAALPKIPSAGLPMLDLPAEDLVPLPRPRPNRAG